MNRISSNESFPRNVILSIDPNEENYHNNFTTFRTSFQNSLADGKDPQEAVEIATNRLKKLVEKRKQIFIPKPGNKKDRTLHLVKETLNQYYVMKVIENVFSYISIKWKENYRKEAKEK